MAEKHRTLQKVVKQTNLEVGKIKKLSAGKVDKPVSTWLTKLTPSKHPLNNGYLAEDPNELAADQLLVAVLNCTQSLVVGASSGG